MLKALKKALMSSVHCSEPLTDPKQIKKAINLMIKNKSADSLRSISIPERSPYKMWIKKKKELIYLRKHGFLECSYKVI